MDSEVTITVRVATTVDGEMRESVETLLATADLADAELRKKLTYDTSCLLVRASTKLRELGTRPQAAA